MDLSFIADEKIGTPYAQIVLHKKYSQKNPTSKFLQETKTKVN